MCHPSANSAVLSNTKILKFLGILSDIKLMWKCHIDFISLKLVKATDDISFAYSAILILRDMCVGLCNQTHINELLILQKRALRSIYFAPSNAHANPFLFFFFFIKYFTCKYELFWYRRETDAWYLEWPCPFASPLIFGKDFAPSPLLLLLFLLSWHQWSKNLSGAI